MNKEEKLRFLNLTKNYKRNLRKLKRIYGLFVDKGASIALNAVSKLYDEAQVKLLLDTLYKNGLAINEIKGKGKQNIAQVALRTGYSEDFIVDLIESYNIDVNYVDATGLTIMHTSFYSKNDFFDYEELYDYLISKGFNSHALSDLGRDIVQEAISVNLDNEMDFFNQFLAKEQRTRFLCKFYHKNFDLFMDRLTDNVVTNQILIEKAFSFGDYKGMEHRQNNLKYPNELLLLCTEQKYNEELVIKTIERLLVTKIVDINACDAHGYNFILLAIKNGYSNESILKIIKNVLKSEQWFSCKNMMILLNYCYFPTGKLCIESLNLFEQSFNKLLSVNLDVDLYAEAEDILREYKLGHRVYFIGVDLMSNLKNVQIARQISDLCHDNNIIFIQEDVSSYDNIRIFIEQILKMEDNKLRLIDKEELELLLSKVFNIIIDEHNMNINLCELEIDSEKVFLTLEKYYDELNNEFGSNKVYSLKK